MVYTCYEMIRDCRDGRPEGWSYFVSHYVPVVRRLLAHYFSDRAGEGALMERVLVKLRDPQSRLFQSLDPAPERLFVAELRQHVRRAVETDRASPAPEMALDVETLGAALESFTLTEKLVVWFETMRYGAQDAGRMLRMSAETADKIRVRASESIRGKLDAWRSSILVDNGLILGQAAAGLATKDCPPGKSLLRCDRRPCDLARTRRNGAACERLLSLPGSLLPIAGSVRLTARSQTAGGRRGLPVPADVGDRSTQAIVLEAIVSARAALSGGTLAPRLAGCGETCSGDRSLTVAAR